MFCKVQIICHHRGVNRAHNHDALFEVRVLIAKVARVNFLLNHVHHFSLGFWVIQNQVFGLLWLREAW